MNILIDARWINTSNIDGISNFTINIIKELLNNFGDKFYILLKNKEEYHFLRKNFNLNSEKVIFLDIKINSFKNIFKIRQLINNLNIKLYFSPNIVFFLPFINCKKIVVIHDIIPLIYKQYFKNASFKFKLFFTNRFIYKKILNFSDKIITVSNSTKKDLKKILKINKEISVIYEGSFFSNKENNIEVLKEKYFLFVGRHEYYKNIHSLIDLYNLLPLEIKNSYKLIIIGKFYNKYTDYLKNKVRNYNLDNNIVFIDNLLPNEILKYYKNCFILIHLSLYEGFGLTILEAMSFGKPVIAYNVSSIPEILKEKELLFQVNDVENIKK
ncbi:MAG: glycosyl transferase [Candidatus Sericytochromatia bacterium]|nr:MAG: glycosyl transferase [Candidatus Sericytochromatia bacterium]